MIFVVDDLNDLGDHIAAPFYQYPIADFYPQAINFVLVVQRGAYL